MTRQHYRLRLREFRKAAGLTQAEMARRIGCAPSTYGQIERGDVLVSALLESLIAHELNLSLDDHNQAFGYPTFEPAPTNRAHERGAEDGRRRLSIVPLPARGGVPSR